MSSKRKFLVKGIILAIITVCVFAIYVFFGLKAVGEGEEFLCQVLLSVISASLG